MEQLIQVKKLSRDYKIAKRDGSFLKFMFSREHKIIHAVNSIDFSILKGELVGFVGPNGAGKSTTIKMLAGILAPTSGEVSVIGNDPFKKRKQNAYHIGVIFGQRSQLWWDLPIGDTFKLLKKIYKTPDDIYEKNLGLFKEYLDLESIWNQPVRQLSLGQRMRAEIAAAILHNPELLFLDEPTIGLDIVAKRQIREFILKLNRDYQTTVILTSHDMKDIEEICERIILIDKGVIVVDCPVDELKQSYNKTAVVKVNLNEPVLAFDIVGAIGRPEDDGLKWNFEVDKSITTTGHLVFEISKIAEISDIEIKEQAVEDIIHDIYKNGV
ncbi:MAG: ATP-binding cassette domain-containing protein [Candidatus Cloacimonetes bacterium]|nr:ATP-binding cassette domain-containing protein [Clostridia bacterium]MDD2683307.1 ATP-binding cassette domain-containing protein [Candidatus Cloacimonadota bacterium]MDD3092663.1 ATP-binding cassette domain-containing protein [Clostridia bacterium]MDD3971476.1 ATP-binding cassette domain-containing protein [Clostridia bacterium]